MARKKTPKQLTTEQEQVIDALLAGKTRVEASASAGVPVTEVHAWFESDALFVASFNLRQQDAHQAQVEKLRNLAGDAVEALSGLLQSENESVRLKAVATVLKTVGLGEVAAPGGNTTTEAVEAGWRQAAAIRGFSLY